jgi:hypothetical protein
VNINCEIEIKYTSCMAYAYSMEEKKIETDFVLPDET